MNNTGKITPQATDVEASLLGALLSFGRVYDEISDIVNAEMFYDPRHKAIYEAITAVRLAGSPVDLVTVYQELKKAGAKGITPSDIAALTSTIGSGESVETWARIIAQKHIGRRLIAESAEIIQKAYDERLDVFETLQNAEQRILSIANTNISRPIRTTAKIANEALTDVMARADNTGGNTLHTGIYNLDHYTGGLEPCDLIVLAARPGMGKTAFVLSIVQNLSVSGDRAIGFFSLEMSAGQLIKRLMCQETGVDSDSLKRGHLTDAEKIKLQWAASKIAQSQLYIDDTPGLSIMDFRSKARRMKVENNVRLIVVDYLQLMTAPGNSTRNRDQEVGEITRMLKGVAKELDIPIIALAQMNRQIEARGNKLPTLSDLRESGNIEQDADMVLFLNRPEYFGLKEDDGHNALPDGYTQLIFAKYRNGSIGTVALTFKKQIMRYE
jgi:replicative DNA helicase